MGSGKKYLQGLQYQADSNQQISQATNETDLEIAKVQSDAVFKQAKFEYDARIAEKISNEKIQFEALRIREKEAELNRATQKEENKNDALRAEGALLKGQADLEDARNDREKDRQDYELDRNRQQGGSDYWYGD